MTFVSAATFPAFMASENSGISAFHLLTVLTATPKNFARSSSVAPSSKQSFALLLASYSGGHNDITGNELGGTMPWFATNERAVFQAADAHCKKYGRAAKITQIIPYAG